jgi:hypothetical protein
MHVVSHPLIILKPPPPPKTTTTTTTTIIIVIIIIVVVIAIHSRLRRRRIRARAGGPGCGQQPRPRHVQRAKEVQRTQLILELHGAPTLLPSAPFRSQLVVRAAPPILIEHSGASCPCISAQPHPHRSHCTDHRTDQACVPHLTPPLPSARMVR